VPDLLRPMTGFADSNADAVPVWPMTTDNFDDWAATLTAAQQAWLETHDFNAQRGRTITLPAADGTLAGVAFGLGSGGAEGRIFGEAAFSLPEGTYRIDPVAGTEVDLERAALGWLLGSYSFTAYKAKSGRSPAALIAPEGIDSARIGRMAAGMGLARDLINTPAEDMGPPQLEERHSLKRPSVRSPRKTGQRSRRLSGMSCWRRTIP